MSVDTVVAAIQAWPFSAVIRGETEGSEWVFPIIETCHVLTLTIVFGSISMVDLRLMGLVSRGTPVARLAEEILPWTWIAWGLSAITGTMMFTAKAVTYYGNFQFRMKFLCMALAAVNMLVFHFGAFRNVAQWNTGAPPIGARVAGGLSMLLWIGVVFFGRWIGFTT